MKAVALVYVTLLVVFSTGVSMADGHTVEPYALPVVNFEQDTQGFFVNQPDDVYLRYMWDSFVALSWPAETGERGVPDTSATVPASASPVVWETYPQPQEVFLPQTFWDNYPTWETLPARPANRTLEDLQRLCPGYSQEAIVLYAINQPDVSIESGPVAPLMDQFGRYVRYQVTMNRRYFEYVREHQYYRADVQADAVRVSQEAQFKQRATPPPGGFVSLPVDDEESGALETKAAWRLLDPDHDRPERYYTRDAFVISPDQTQCEQGKAGLVALHIHRMTRLGHVAATFEHIDNVEVDEGALQAGLRPSFNPGTSNATQSNLWPPYGNLGFSGSLPPVITAKDTLPPLALRQPNNISRATAIPPAVQAVNREYQTSYLDSVLKYYQLIDVQHAKAECKMRETGVYHAPHQWDPVSCPQPNTERLINTALESYTQLVNPFTERPHNYSCKGCHSYARPCGFASESDNQLTYRAQFTVMSYLLSKAKFPGQQVSVDAYSCNNPATQPLGRTGRDD